MADLLLIRWCRADSMDSVARKFPPNQIHLSLSIPPSLNLSSGPSLDPMASRFLLMMEKKLVDWLQDILANEIE